MILHISYLGYLVSLHHQFSQHLMWTPKHSNPPPSSHLPVCLHPAEALYYLNLSFSTIHVWLNMAGYLTATFPSAAAPTEPILYAPLKDNSSFTLLIPPPHTHPALEISRIFLFIFVDNNHNIQEKFLFSDVVPMWLYSSRTSFPSFYYSIKSFAQASFEHYYRCVQEVVVSRTNLILVFSPLASHVRHLELPSLAYLCCSVLCYPPTSPTISTHLRLQCQQHSLFYIKTLTPSTCPVVLMYFITKCLLSTNVEF